MKIFSLFVSCLFFTAVILSCSKPGPGETPSSGTGLLKGTIYSPNGKIIFPSIILETEVNGVKKATTTDKEGKFELELPAGSYEIKMFAGSGVHFSTQKRVAVAAGKTTELAPADTRLSFSGKIAYVEGEFDAIQVLLTEMGIPTTRLTTTDMQDYNRVKQFDVLLLNCSSEYIDFEENKMLERYLKEGHSIYASDHELRAFSKEDWGFIPENLISFELDGVEGVTEANVVYEPFKKALGKNKMEIEFDLPMYVQIKHLAADPRIKVLVDHPQKGPLALNIQWGPAKTSAFGHTYGGNILYTTFHDAALSADVKAVLQQMILQL